MATTSPANDNLAGWVALITGSGTGIGLAMAKGFAARGAKVYITGRRKEVLDAAAAQNPGLVALPLDVTDKDSIRDAVKIVQANDGKLDVLINNAGIVGPYTPFVTDRTAPENKTLGTSVFETETFDQWASVFATNTSGPFFVTAAFLELLVNGANLRPKGETSSVINISSAVPHVRLSMSAFAYGVTKAGIERLTDSFGAEFAHQGIPVRVNTIAPGLFASELAGSFEDVTEAAKIAGRGGLFPAPVLRPGRDDEAASAAIFLATSGYTNGTVILLDGGFSVVNP